MKRREFITLIGGAAAWPFTARAQQAMPLVGVLSSTEAAGRVAGIAALRRGLGEGGYVEGRNIALEFRWADNQYDRLPTLATDLVQRQAAVIVYFGAVQATVTAASIRAVSVGGITSRGRPIRPPRVP